MADRRSTDGGMSPVTRLGVSAVKGDDDVLAAARARKYRHSVLAYWIMTLLGAGMLFPWNAVVNAVGYFNHLYPGKQFEFYVALAYIAPQLIVVAMMVKWGDRISFTIRIVSMFLVQAFLLVLIPVVSKLTDESVSFWANLLWCFLIGVSTSILQPSVFGFSSQLPPIFNQAIMAGQGVAGAGVSFMRLATKGFVPNQRLSALLFFSISCAVMVICVFAYYALLKMEFTQYHLDKAITVRAEVARLGTPKSRAKSVPATPGSAASSADASAAPNTPASGDSALQPVVTPKRLTRKFTLKVFLSKRLGIRSRATDVEQQLLDDSDDEGEDPQPGTLGHFCYLTGKMGPHAVGVFLIFVITFSVFPGEITSIKYEGTFPALNFMAGSWWPIILVTVFNCFDLTGRSLASILAKHISGKTVLIVSVLRTLFIPLFILNVHNPDVHVFSDLFCLGMVAAYAITNGMFSTIAMMKGPALVPPHEREAAGFFMTLFLQAGIFVGAFAALAVKALNEVV